MFRGFVFSGGNVVMENSPAEIVKALKNPKSNVWIDFEDPSETDIDFLIDEFNLQSLSIEEAILPHDHPKLEIYDDYVSLTMYDVSAGNDTPTHEINIFLGKDYLITYHEDKIAPVTRMMNRMLRIASGDYIEAGAEAKRGADMLMYTAVSAIIDGYFPVIESIENSIALLEDRLLEEKDIHIMEGILEQKRRILVLRKLFFLEKQVIAKMIREDSGCVTGPVKAYFQDALDHLMNMQETLEILREILPSLIETYHSMSSKKLNQMIHRLTILATIAIPMTVITSFYGMNLQLPEFKWGIWGYVFMMSLLVLASVGTYIVLKIKKWL
jgi:magnesium transporter